MYKCWFFKKGQWKMAKNRVFKWWAVKSDTCYRNNNGCALPRLFPGFRSVRLLDQFNTIRLCWLIHSTKFNFFCWINILFNQTAQFDSINIHYIYKRNYNLESPETPSSSMNATLLGSLPKKSFNDSMASREPPGPITLVLYSTPTFESNGSFLNLL